NCRTTISERRRRPPAKLSRLWWTRCAGRSAPKPPRAGKRGSHRRTPQSTACWRGTRSPRRQPCQLCQLRVLRRRAPAGSHVRERGGLVMALRYVIRLAALPVVLALAGCDKASEPPLAADTAYSEAETAGSLPPSP